MGASETKPPSEPKGTSVKTMSRLIASLEYSPDEILSMPLSEVLSEIVELGIDPKSFRRHVEERVTVVRGRVSSVSLYEITDNELSTLETGSSSSLYLNFSIFLLSVAISMLVTLLTTPIQDNRVFNVFVIIVSCGFIIGGFLLLLWYRTRHSMSEVVKSIRGRIPIEKTLGSDASSVD